MLTQMTNTANKAFSECSFTGSTFLSSLKGKKKKKLLYRLVFLTVQPLEKKSRYETNICICAFTKKISVNTLVLELQLHRQKHLPMWSISVVTRD